jgi:hypothetical protein
MAVCHKPAVREKGPKKISRQIDNKLDREDDGKAKI